MKKAIAFIIALVSVINFTVLGLAQTKADALKALREAEGKINILRGHITSINTQQDQIEIKQSGTDEKKTITVNPERIRYLKVGDEVKIRMKAGDDVARSVRVITRGTTVIPEEKNQEIKQ